MTLAEAIIRKNPGVLTKNVFRLMGIVQDKYRQPVAQAIKEIIILAHAAVDDNIANDKVIYCYAGYRENFPACFVDMVCKPVKINPIPSWDAISPIWIPLDERLDYEKIPMEELKNFVPAAKEFDVKPITMDDITAILGAEIYAVPLLADRIPETVLALHLIRRGYVAFGWTGLCHISAGIWNLKQLSEEEDVLQYLCTEPSLTEDQLELRDDLFNNISLYHTVREYQKQEEYGNEEHQKPG